MNVSEIISESEGFEYEEIDSIRSSFIYKIAQKFGVNGDLEIHLNAMSVLTELADFKAVY